MTHEKNMIEAALAEAEAERPDRGGGRQAWSSALDDGLEDPVTEDQHASLYTHLAATRYNRDSPTDHPWFIFHEISQSHEDS